jgi:mannose-6-phosphate isomerase-like protein (cupin superfamily)
MTAAATAVSSNPAPLSRKTWDLAPWPADIRCCAVLIERRGHNDRPTLIGPDAFHRPAAETPGVDRREAFAEDHVWAGRARTDGGTWSGWHVHPGHDTYVFQTQGRLRLEFGPSGAESVEGGPGDFVCIPKGGAP